MDKIHERIIVELGAVVPMRTGLPTEAEKSIIEILRNMKHHVLLANKISELVLESGVDPYFDVVGQGTGWGLCIWKVVFDIILTTVQKYQPRFLLKSPDGKGEEFRMVEKHVDDSR